MCKSLVWVPPPGCARGGALAPPPRTLLDCLSTDLLDMDTGNVLLDTDVLRAAAAPAWESM